MSTSGAPIVQGQEIQTQISGGSTQSTADMQKTADVYQKIKQESSSESDCFPSCLIPKSFCVKRLRSQDESSTQSGPKSDWIKIAAIVGAVIFGLIMVFGALCTTNQFPPAFLGGKIGAASITAVSGVLFIGLGITVWLRHRNQPTSA